MHEETESITVCEFDDHVITIPLNGRDASIVESDLTLCVGGAYWECSCGVHGITRVGPGRKQRATLRAMIKHNSKSHVKVKSNLTT